MDADAKGQVGGLDVDVAVRRRYAVESRGWVCDVCEGGRSNEEVLREWREVCRAKGVEVEEDDVQGATPEKTEAEPEREPSETNADASAETVTSQRESESLPSRDAAPKQVEAQVPVPSAPAEAPAPAPAPTRTTPVQTTTATTATSRTTTSDAPWLDRAILGVLVALAFMIVRRLAKSEEY
jgi:ubiquitin-conjugating enzyme E2 J1